MGETPEYRIPDSVQADLVEDGLLWLINTTTLHPRGFALAYDPETKNLTLMGDGSEPWEFTHGMADEKFAAVEALLQRAREHNKR